MSTNFGDARRTLSTGDLVISVSEIFDRLQTKIDPNTLEQLLRDILADRRNQVRPGELITAELMNQILAELESLQVRVTKLEAGVVVTPSAGAPPVATPLELTDLLPHGTRTVGDEVTLVGKNFVTPVEINNQLKVGDKSVLIFKPGSDGSHLIFDIPDGSTASQTAIPATIEVKNKNGTATLQFQLKAASTAPAGELLLEYTDPPVVELATGETVPLIKNGRTYDFIFTLTARVDRDATYNLSPTITGSGWTARALDESDQTITQIPIAGNLAPGVQRRIRVRVQVPPALMVGGVAQPQAARLTLNVTETSSGSKVTPGTKSIDLAVNSPLPVPDTRVTVGLGSIGDLKFENGRLVIPQSSTGSDLSVNVNITTDGIFRVTASFRNAAGWSTTEPLISGKVLNGAGSRPVNVKVKTTAGAAPTDLLINITRTSGGDAFTSTYTLPIKAGS